MRSPDAEPPGTEVGPIRKEGPQGYTLHTEVDEVVLNCTVLDGNRLVPRLAPSAKRVRRDTRCTPKWMRLC